VRESFTNASFLVFFLWLLPAYKLAASDIWTVL